MKARRNLTIATAIAALIPLGVAVAGDKDSYGSQSDKMTHATFKKLDTNKDGRISQAEAAADSTIMFTSADTNGDGYIDKDEWKAASKGSAQPQSQPQPQSDSRPMSSDPTPSSSVPEGSVPSNNDTMPENTGPQPDTENPRQ